MLILSLLRLWNKIGTLFHLAKSYCESATLGTVTRCW